MKLYVSTLKLFMAKLLMKVTINIDSNRNTVWTILKASLAARIGPFGLVDKQFYRPKKIWSLEIYQKICCFFFNFLNPMLKI